MKMKIVATTDGKFIGHEFESEDKVLRLAKDIAIQIEKVLPLENGLRFAASSYIIDAIKVNHG